MIPPLLLGGQPLVPQTQLAIGIWPPNDQTAFERPIALVVAPYAVPTANSNQSLELRMFNPANNQWQPLLSTLNLATGEISATIQAFTPLPKEFPMWGWRTLTGVFAVESQPAAAAAAPRPVAPAPAVASPPEVCTVFNIALALRAAPDANSPSMRRLERGTQLIVLERTADSSWLHAQVKNNGDEGWVRASPLFLRCGQAQPAAAVAPSSPPSLCTVFNIALPLRTAPNTDSPSIARIDRGVQLVALDRTSDANWLRVQAGEGNTEGWVRSSSLFLRCDFDIPSLPVFAG
jgi:uncharacterized protein YraI